MKNQKETPNKYSLPHSRPDSFFSGPELIARTGMTYGMSVFKAQFNPNNAATVTQLSQYTPQPLYDTYLHKQPFLEELANLWRQLEFNWNFMPKTPSKFIEYMKCSGTFPNANCKSYFGNNTLGEIVDDALAKSIGLYSLHPEITTWDELVLATGSGKIWEIGDDWQTLFEGRTAPNDVPFITISVARTPNGTKEINYKDVNAKFIPTTTTEKYSPARSG